MTEICVKNTDLSEKKALGMTQMILGAIKSKYFIYI